MDLAKFCRLVEAGGWSLPDFVSKAMEEFPTGSADERVLLAVQPEGSEPHMVRKARCRAEQGADGTIPRAHLERLDESRYDDPAKAKRGVEASIDFVGSSDVPFALGVYASCCRALLQTREAWFAINAGLETAQGFAQLPSRCDLWRRAAVIHLVACEFGLALSSSEKAMAGYARLGDFPRLGRTLIDQGTILWEVGRTDEAESALRRGLKLITPTDRRHLCAGTQFFGALLRLKGKASEALEAAYSAVPLAETQVEKGKLRWLEALCLADLGKNQAARDSFVDAFQRLKDPVPVDAALLVCDQVRFMLEAGMVSAALDQARAVRCLIIPLERLNPRVAAIACELATIELETGRDVACALVGELKKRIEEARRPKPAGSKILVT